MNGKEELEKPNHLKESSIRFLLLPVDVGDVFERPDVLHRLPDEGVDRLRPFEVVPGHLVTVAAISGKEVVSLMPLLVILPIQGTIGTR